MNSDPGSKRIKIYSQFVLYIVLIIIVCLAMFCMYVNNQIIKRDEQIRSSWAQVESVMQRRYSLIPNLVNTTKGYLQYENKIVDAISRDSSMWSEAKTETEKLKLSDKLEDGIRQLILTAQRYPILKATQSFSELNIALEGSENRIAIERRRYNEAIFKYNLYVKAFPANLFGYLPKDEYFQANRNLEVVTKEVIENDKN